MLAGGELMKSLFSTSKEQILLPILSSLGLGNIMLLFNALYLCQQQRGNLHTNNQNTLHQLFSEVVKLTGFAEHKGLNYCVDEELFAEK